MPITYIITNDNIGNFNDFYQDDDESRNDIIESRSIFIGTGGTREDIDSALPIGIHLDIEGDVVKEDEGGGQYLYHFIKNDIHFSLDGDGDVYILTNSMRFHDNIVSDRNIRRLTEFLNGLVEKTMVKKRGRNLIEVDRVGKSKGLPSNMEAEIAKYLSGKNGPLVSQTNKLKQNLGIQLAPRVNGGRKTRKARK